MKTPQTQNTEGSWTENPTPTINLPVTQEAEDAEFLDENSNSLDKVRDILFGSQTRENDQKLTDLEMQLAKGLAELRSETINRIETLGEDLQQQFEKLSEQVLAAEAERARDSQKMSQRLEEIRTEVSRQLIVETKRLVERIEGEHHKTMAYIDRAVDSLEDAKTDRNTLSQMFAYMASRLEGNNRTS